jgi:hypothetical protein
MRSFVILFCSLTTAFAGAGDKVFDGFKNMANDWDGFKGLFAENAVMRMCGEGEAKCNDGSFDQIFGAFQGVLKFAYFEQTVLTEGYRNDFLHHWSQYVETHSDCNATWSGYSMYEFNNNGEIQRLNVFSEDSKGVFGCIQKSREVLSTTA